ncbi:hypothetical protein IFR05_015914 [Cadophora sp. M221]|nr:hypothetical protein IFR05_015914 [Cadophora sp. M221]
MADEMQVLVQIFRDLSIKPKPLSDSDEGEVALLESEPTIIATTGAGSVELASVAKPESEPIHTAEVLVSEDATELTFGAQKKDRSPSGVSHEETRGHAPGIMSTNAVRSTDKTKLIGNFECELLLFGVNKILKKYICHADEHVPTFGGSFVTKQVDRVLSDFHLFPQLPIELRFKIWEMTTRRSRIIPLRNAFLLNDSGAPSTWHFVVPFKSTPRPKYLPGLHPSVPATGLQITKLMEIDPKIFNGLGVATGCKVLMPNPAIEDGIPREIGVEGSKHGVKQCKDAIQEVLNEVSIVRPPRRWY